MIEFLEKYALLSNKNSPIIIRYGSAVTDCIFNTRIDQNRLDSIIQNIKSLNLKLSIMHTKDITEYRMDNHSIIKNSSGLEYNIYHIIDKHIDQNLYMIKYSIQNNDFIVPSFEEYEHIEKYDTMQIGVNNILDIVVKDYQKYFTLYVIIKKPNSSTTIKNILEKIFI